MSRRTVLLPLAALLLVGPVAAESRRAVVPPSAAELSAHVSALTAPEMEGRAAGTAGNDRAARYIADRLAAAGLTPAGDGGSLFQSFVVAGGARVGSASALERLGSTPRALEVGRDWTPHGGSLAAEVSGEIVFVGYGVAAADRGWDDYAGVAVRDKIALALDGAPGPLGDLRPSRLDKLIAARRHGARALLIVGDALPSLGATTPAVRLVSGAITRAAADLLLAPSGKTTAQLAATLAGARAPVSFATGAHARLRVALEHEDRRTANVIAIMRGTDPARAGEAVVLGAHYDHLGRVGGVVHPGADDNASGTALVLGLARALATAGGAPRTLVFALFSGEEAGLLGSTHYVRHPAVAIDRTVAMLNFDMVGRLRDRQLNVSGVESGTGLRAVVTEAAVTDRLELALHDTPFAPSDQTPFYEAGAPVLFFTTGGHDDYHTPRDTADRINAAGMAEIADLAARIVARLVADPRPAYVTLSRPSPERRAGGPPGSAFLGISADAGGEADGLRVASVLSETAAARAGFERGDVIVRLGDVVINSFDDLKRLLASKRPGETVGILYLRDGEDRLVSVTLGARP